MAIIDYGIGANDKMNWDMVAKSDEARRQEEDQKQKRIEWELKNKKAKQAWEDEQELRALGSAVSPSMNNMPPQNAQPWTPPPQVEVPNTEPVNNWNRVAGLAQGGESILTSAREDRERQDTAAQNLASAVDTSSETGAPRPANENPQERVKALSQQLEAENKVPMPKAVPSLANAIAPPPETRMVAAPAGAAPAGAAPAAVQPMHALGQRQAELLLKQGKWKEAIEAAKAPLEITEVVPAHAQKMTGYYLTLVENYLAGGKPPEEAKALALQEMQRFGLQPQELAGLQKIDFQPGGVAVTKTPSGTVTHTLSGGKYSAVFTPSLRVEEVIDPNTGEAKRVVVTGKGSVVPAKSMETTAEQAKIKFDYDMKKLGVTQAHAEKMLERKAVLQKELKMTNNMNLASPEDEAIAAQMLVNNELVPAQMPKRSASYFRALVQAKRLDPNFNARDADANYNLAKNPNFRSRAITAEQLPEVLTNMVEAGKKVNFSDTKFVGIAEKWAKGQLNDPDLVEYMALRNDSLMEIAQVMRQSGVTDKATEMENEAAHPSMSPRALDAWMTAQMKALQPRLKLLRKVISPAKPVAGTGATSSGNTPRTANHPKLGLLHVSPDNKHWMTSDNKIVNPDGTVQP